MAGLAGFEPAHDGIKTRCLTAWRQPNIDRENRLVKRVVIARQVQSLMFSLSNCQHLFLTFSDFVKADCNPC